jgi:hypothetical protein
MPPMIAPTADPAPIRPASPRIPFALDRLGDGATHRVGPPVDRHLVEGERERAFAIGPRGAVDGADDPAHHRAGRDEDAIPVRQVHDRRRLEPILDLGVV